MRQYRMYALTTSSGSPNSTTLPWWSHSAVVAIDAHEVQAVGDEHDRAAVAAQLEHLLRRSCSLNFVSPPVRASSMRRTSGSRWAATAKPSRDAHAGRVGA